MNNIKTARAYLKGRPILIGLFTVLFTVAVGIAASFASGFTTPSSTFAASTTAGSWTFTTVNTADAHGDATSNINTANVAASVVTSATYNGTFSQQGPTFDQQCQNAEGNVSQNCLDVLNTLIFTFTLPAGSPAHFEWDGAPVAGLQASVIFQGGIPFLNTVPSSISGANVSHTLSLVVDNTPGVCAPYGVDNINKCAAGTLGSNSVQTDGSNQWYCNGTPDTDANRSPLCFYTPPVITPTASVAGQCAPYGVDNINKCATGTLGSNSVQTDGSSQWYCDGTPNDTAHRSPLCFYTPSATPPSTVVGSCGTPLHSVTNACNSGTLGSHAMQPDGSFQWYCDGTPNTSANRSPLCYKTVVPVDSGLCSQVGLTVPGTPTNGGFMLVCNGTFWESCGFSPQRPECTAPPIVPPVVWTNYCTGSTDQNGHNWQIWAHDNSTPPNYKFVENGTVENGCVPNVPPTTTLPVCDLSVTLNAIQVGDSTTLSWTTNRTNSSMSSDGYPLSPVLTIDNGIGQVALAGGSVSISPTVTTTYTGTIYDSYDFSPRYEAKCTAKVTVTATPPPPPPPSHTATIKVIKVVNNTHGGTKVVANFPLFVNTTSVVSGVTNTFSPATYTISETNQPGYDATFSGDCDATSHQLTLAADQHKVCTITNNDIPPVAHPATIQVIKVVNNTHGGTKVVSNFELFVSTTAGFQLPDGGGMSTIGVTTGVVSGVVNTFAPGSYTVSELNLPNYTATFSGDCDATSHQLTLAADQHKVCTITNNDIPSGEHSATIQVIKVVNNTHGGTKVVADFPLFVSSPNSTTTVTSGVTNTFSPNTYLVTETNQPGYDASFSGDCDSTGHLTLTTDQHKVCTITNNDIGSPPPPPPGGCTSNCGGGGGGGGGSPKPHVILSSVPHGQVLGAYLYLSQVPYTGLDLGPVGTVLYWLALVAWALALAYLVLFGAAPVANRSLRNFGARVASALNAQGPQFAGVSAAVMQQTHSVTHEPHIVMQEVAPAPEASRGYSTYDGFKSFARNGALSIEDVVKSLSRQHVAAPAPQQAAEIPHPNIEPIYNNVEPVYENVEPIEADSISEQTIPASTRGFTAALLEGDRAAVFAGLRQHVRGGGSPEQLISPIVCLLDDAYRARVDGTACDADIARLTARLNTPTLEKLIGALTNAIDSSYSTDVTGAKLALTRALGVLGA